MAVYVSTSCLKGGRDALTVVRKYVDAGIRHIELGSAHASTVGLNELLTFPGLRLAAHGTFTGRTAPRGTSLFSRDEQERLIQIKQIKEDIRLCSALGAAFYTFHPLAPGDIDSDWQAGVAALREVAREAEEVGIPVGIENVHYGKLGHTGLLDRAEEMQSLIKEIGSPMLKVLLDLGHLKLAAVQEQLDPVHFIRLLAPYTIAIHVHDNDGKTDEHLPLNADSEVAQWIKMSELSNIPVILEVTRQTMPDILHQLALLEWLIREDSHL